MSNLPGKARAVYRALCRASAETMAGDELAQSQFRGIIRSVFLSPTLTSPFDNRQKQPTTVAHKSCSDASSSAASSSSAADASSEPVAVTNGTQSVASITPEEYSAKLDHWAEVALLLRTNIVQGKKEGVTEAGEDRYKLRITKNTELRDRTQMKTPASLPTTPFPNRRRRATVKAAGTDV